MSTILRHTEHGDDEADTRLRIAQLALDNSLDSILIHDLDGRLVFFNDAAAVNLGYTPDEFAKLGPWGFAAHATDSERAERMTAIRDAGELTFYSDGRLKNGEPWVARVRSRWVETDEGPMVVSVSHDVTEPVAARQELERLAFHDQLTGLANRSLFDDRLEVAMAAAVRHGLVLGVAFIDIDGFKHVNDTLGHEVGDELLGIFAERLQRAVRAEDTVARYGGDEFVALFPNLSAPEDLDALAAKLRERLAEPVVIDGHRLDMSGSVGVAVFDPENDDVRTLMMRADVSMYEAKRKAARWRRYLRLVS